MFLAANQETQILVFGEDILFFHLPIACQLSLLGAPEIDILQVSCPNTIAQLP